MHGANVNGNFEASAVLCPESLLVPPPAFGSHYGRSPSRVVRRYAVLFYQRCDLVEVRSQCRKIGEGKKVRFPCSPTMFDELVDEEAKQTINTAFTEIVGEPIQVELVKQDIVAQTMEGSETPEKEVRTTPMMRKRQAAEDTQLKPVLDLFDAKIVETQ